MKIEEIIIYVFFIGISSYAMYYLISLSKIKNAILIQLDSKEISAYKRYIKTIKKQSNTLNTFTRANQFYNLESLLNDNGINIRLYLAIPSLLIGLGVLGTFIGFSLTVLSISDVLDSSNQLESMKKLFSSVKIAFLSSVTGMFWSFVFSKFEKIKLYQLKVKIDQFCNQLDEEYFISHDEYIRNFIRNIENYLSTDFNKTFTDNLNNSFRLINDNFKEKTDDFFKKSTETLRIESEKIEQQLNKWESSLNEQNKIVVSSVSLLSTLPVTLKKQLDEISVSFTDLDKNIEVTVNKLAFTNSEINTYISKWSIAIQAQSAVLKQQEESIKHINIMLSHVPTITEELSVVNKSFLDIVKSFQQTDNILRSNIADINGSFSSINQEFNKTSKDINSSIQSFSSTINTGNNELKVIVGTLDKSVKDVKFVFDGLDNTIEQRLTKTNNLLVNYFNAIDKLSEKIVATYTSTKNGK